MAERVQTVRVVSDETPMGYLVINASEFDSKLHQRHSSDPGGQEPGAALPSTASPSASTDAADKPDAFAVRDVPTLRIVSDEHPQGWVTINASDFDASVHEEFDPAEEQDGEPSLPGAPEDLATLSVKDLRDRATKLGVKFSARTTKADLQSAILEHLTAPDSPQE